MTNYDYDIAVSFAGEDREIAEQLSLELVKRNIRVFYDDFEKHELWGKDLVEFLYDVFSKRARYCLMLISSHYLEKRWPRHEGRSAMERALSENREYILPVRLDDTSIPGLPSTVSYVDYGKYKIPDIADLVVRKLGAPGTEFEEEGTSESTYIPRVLESLMTSSNEWVEEWLERHSMLSKRILPNRQQNGYFSIHLKPDKIVKIPKSRFEETFLDRNKQYSEGLQYSNLPEVHPDGYTRVYSVLKKGERIPAEATTCYRDGHLVLEGYLDESLRGRRGFNPNQFLYQIQRHLQLGGEVLSDLTDVIKMLVHFEFIEDFRWELYWGGSVSESREYVGYHRDIIHEVQISDIHGRSNWNLKMDNAEAILVEIARMFGMDKLPQPYWNNENHLAYAAGFQSR